MEERSHVGMLNCWICGKGSTILLDRLMRKTLHKNMGSLPNEICSECKSLAEDNNGIWIISIRDGEEIPIDSREVCNPYRTGGLALIKKEALKRLFKESISESKKYIEMVDKNFYFYLENSVWNYFGLPEYGVEINNLEGQITE